MQLNAEIATQLDLISGNTDLLRKVLAYLRALTVRVKPLNEDEERDRTKRFIDSFAGKWEDDRTADKMVADIYASRKNHADDELIRILDA